MERVCFCGATSPTTHKMSCNAAIRAAWAKYEMIRCRERVEENFRRAITMPGAPGCPGFVSIRYSEILPGDIVPGR